MSVTKNTTPVLLTALLEAWAERCEIDQAELSANLSLSPPERKHLYWLRDFDEFTAGWEAARKAAVACWQLVPDGTEHSSVPEIKRVVFGK